MRKMDWFLGIVLLAIGIQCSTALASNDIKGKHLNVFNVVKFPNTVCAGSSSLNGTCYTSSECSNKGGTSSGTCANGYGVCCIFTLGCGGKVAENVTYFQSSASQAAGQCGVTVCKSSSDICQLRIDMTTFVIAGPNTLTTSYFLNNAGSPSTGLGIASSLATNCQTDTFTVTGNGGTTPPIICGTNTNSHMYVEASDNCNQLNFQLGTNGMGTTIPSTRSWNLKISQLSCTDPNLPPPGCTQYFTGATGTLTTYNYENSWELANQLQTICIRRERGYCKVCYSPESSVDFAVSGKTTNGFIGSGCCNYGFTAPFTWGFDCLNIPGAKNPAGNPLPNNFCGGKLVSAGNAAVHATICTNQLPFHVQFQTDAFTFSHAMVAKKGFKLSYWQTTTC